jgi:hypothetical protein
MWLVAACSVVWAIVCVASSYWLLNYGASGVAVGRLAGFVAYSIVILALALPRVRSASAQEDDEMQSAMVQQVAA